MEIRDLKVELIPFASRGIVKLNFFLWKVYSYLKSFLTKILSEKVIKKLLQIKNIDDCWEGGIKQFPSKLDTIKITHMILFLYNRTINERVNHSIGRVTASVEKKHVMHLIAAAQQKQYTKTTMRPR